MVSAQKVGALIGQYTGDPFKDMQVSCGTTALAANLATVTVGAQVYAAVAVGTTAGAEVGVRCTSSGAQLTAGTVIYSGSASATDTIHYFIVHAPYRA